MGLLVDRPKVNGFGNSNDSNTARRFLQNVELTSNITELDKEILQRCATIFQAINSGFDIIDAEKFVEYAVETARKLVEEYT